MAARARAMARIVAAAALAAARTRLASYTSWRLERILSSTSAMYGCTLSRCSRCAMAVASLAAAFSASASLYRAT